MKTRKEKRWWWWWGDPKFKRTTKRENKKIKIAVNYGVLILCSHALDQVLYKYHLIYSSYWHPFRDKETEAEKVHTKDRARISVPGLSDSQAL